MALFLPKHKIAWLYPGQGSQKVGMGLDAYETFPEAADIFKRADNLLGFSLSRLCFEGPEDALNQDVNAQLAVYTVSCTITEILKSHGISPDIVTGYSSGFYAAAYAAGCFDFERGLSIVKKAGEILLDEGRKIDGCMAVISGFLPEKIEVLCEETGDVNMAIRNTLRQTVISGKRHSVEKVMALALEDGAYKAYMLPAATAYHSCFMKESGNRLLKDIRQNELNNSKLKLLSYMTLDEVNDANSLSEIMAGQLSGQVLWVDVINKLETMATGLMVEVGPGAVISMTVRWINRNIEMLNTSTNDKLADTIKRCRAFREADEL